MSNFIMLKALSRGVSQLNDRSIRRILWLCIGVAVLVFIFLWTGIALILAHTSFFQWVWLEAITDVLSGFATAIVTWFLFPGIVSAVIGLFMDQIANCVEARHYPELPKANGLPFLNSLVSSIKFFSVYFVINICLLPFLLLGPLYLIIFYIANGYLISREYFELVTHRRESTSYAHALRKANKWPLLSLGIAITFLLTVPIINLITPVIAVGAIIHLSQSWRSEKII
jgi:CysZ protein